MFHKNRERSDLHLSDQELLLAADGELEARRAAEVHAHLAACWDCRARMAETEATITDFARAHRQNLDPQLPPIGGARALLRAQIAELAAQPPTGAWRTWIQLHLSLRAVALAGAMALVVLAGSLVFRYQLGRRKDVSNIPLNTASDISSERDAEPDRNLTPGAVQRVTLSDVCAMPHEEVVGEVSTSLRQEVFHEYGIANTHASEYEVDYLITPGLGGTEDIHNLWPEAYTSSTWNARVKDTLEERLHAMVCAGQLDLSTAQRDIATDWIAAYKKYFHTDRPLSLSSDLTPIAGNRRALRN